MFKKSGRTCVSLHLMEESDYLETVAPCQCQLYMFIYIYICTFIYICVYVYIYIYIKF